MLRNPKRVIIGEGSGVSLQRDFISNRGFTLKAIMTGVIGVIIICAMEPYNAYYVGGTHLASNGFAGRHEQ